MNSWKLTHLLNLQPYEFENLLGQLFINMGYKAEVTQASKDTGIDIIISIEKFGLSHLWFVQAKRYTEPIGVKQIREYSSLRYRDKIDGVIIVTTSSYTKDAIQEADDHNVKLIDGILLLKMLNHYMSSHKVQSVNKTDLNESIEDVILKQGEKVLGKTHVILKNNRVFMMCTNHRIFFIKDINSFFSKKREIVLTLDVKDIIGWEIDGYKLYIVLGGKTIETMIIKSKNIHDVYDMFSCLQQNYIRGEHMLKFEHRKNTFLILTNKRIVKKNSQYNTEMMVKKIESIEIKKGNFLNPPYLKLKKVNDSYNLDIECTDINAWKTDIENLIKTS